MIEWVYVLGAATIGSLLSLVGGLYLLYGKKGTGTLQRLAVPFAAGALLAAAFFDLLPEAIELGDASTVLSYSLAGLVLFFILERSLTWFHHHHAEDHTDGITGRRNASLIVVGDVVHNLIDGLTIGAAFVANPAVGLITTVAIAAHEIPQELGDFGLLLSKGMKRKKVLFVNLLSAVATVIGAAFAYGIGEQAGLSESILLAVAAGFFIYIAASDIIPTIHAEPRRYWANIQTAVLVMGIIFVGMAVNVSHQFLPDHGSRHSEE